MIIRRLIVPLSVALVTAHAGLALAQIANDPAFPPLRGAAAAPAASDPAFPPVGGAGTAADSAFPPVNGQPRSSFPVGGAAPITGAGFGSGPPPAAGPQSVGQMQECMKEFMPLREEAEKRGKLIKAASDRRAPAEEACKLIKNYGAAESKMIAYVERNGKKCGIPAQVDDQLKGSHKNTETMTQKVCAAAQQQAQAKPAGPSLSEMLGSSAALPEATPTKKGGSTFDTLNGNVLTR